jgi:hypothetical protein
MSCNNNKNKETKGKNTERVYEAEGKKNKI